MGCYGGPEEPHPEGDRASVVVQKRGNARGAKGGRKMETGRHAGRKQHRECPLDSVGEEQPKYANLSTVIKCLLAAPVTKVNH